MPIHPRQCGEGDLHRSITEAFLAAAENFPDRTALVGTKASFTFREYAGGALAVAASLAQRHQGERVALLAPTSEGFALMYFGAILSGRVPVPLNFLLAPDELARIVSDCEAKTVFTVRAFEKTARAIGTEVVLLEDFLPGALAAKPAAPSPPNDCAMILYTSGTTSTPKGVVLSQENILSNVYGCIEHFDFSPRHRLLGILPLFHTFALTTTLVLPAVVGAATVLMPRFEPAGTLETIAKHSITTLVAVPSMYRAMLRSLERAEVDLSSLELPISGGEPLGEECFEAYREKFGVRLLEGYGLTETSPVISANTPGALKLSTVGRPLANLEVRVADEAGRDAGIDVDGEIQVRGGSVMVGYLNRPEETRAAMTADAFFRTGDMGRMDREGFLKITGRIKEMIISAGENVFPGEVERVLSMHPAVAEAAVIGIPHKLRGEAPKAFVVLAEGAAAGEDELRDFCRQHIARYKVPAQIEFRREFPHGPTGKVLKQRLAEPSSGGAGAEE